MPLRGVGVLVTRPEKQATPLCRLLEAAGARALRLPAIHIVAAGDSRELTGRVGSYQDYDLTIFTSANAVHFAVTLLGPLGKARFAAIGPATARAVGASGGQIAVVPDGGFDSEALLRHPLLADPAGLRVLLVKGQEGRDLLQRELARRGAHVTPADVYRRERVVHEAGVLAAVESAFAAGEIQIVTATSAEIAANLLLSATPALRREFERVTWLVPGARVAATLSAHGIAAPVLLAATAEDHDLLAAIVGWRAGASNA